MLSTSLDLGLPIGAPHELGLDAGRLQRLSDAFAQRIDSGRLAGAVLAVVRHGHIAWFDALGQRDTESGAAMTADSIFRLYSMTKPIASVAAMMLAEQGRVLLSDPVSAWLPSFADQKLALVEGSGAAQTVTLVPVHTPATVRDLLRHTAGLQVETLFESTPVKALYRSAGLGSDQLTLAAWTDLLGAQPLAYTPGTVFDYSHATMVLGRVIEVVSGQTLDRFIAEHVTGPLGMDDTAFYVPEANWPRIAQAARTPGARPAPQLREVKRAPVLLSAAAGMVGTARDYLRFAAMLLNGGELDGVRLLSRATVAHMLSDHLGTVRRDTTSARVLLDGYGFGLGFAVRTATGHSAIPGTVGDAYWGGMAGTQFWVDPERDLAALLLVQQPAEFVACWHLMRQMVYAAVID
jgi:CubicO group peptidase (beta-lactamase class C family)